MSLESQIEKVKEDIEFHRIGIGNALLTTRTRVESMFNPDLRRMAIVHFPYGMRWEDAQERLERLAQVKTDGEFVSFSRYFNRSINHWDRQQGIERRWGVSAPEVSWRTAQYLASSFPDALRKAQRRDILSRITPRQQLGFLIRERNRIYGLTRFPNRRNLPFHKSKVV